MSIKPMPKKEKQKSKRYRSRNKNKEEEYEIDSNSTCVVTIEEEEENNNEIDEEGDDEEDDEDRHPYSIQQRHQQHKDIDIEEEKGENKDRRSNKKKSRKEKKQYISSAFHPHHNQNTNNPNDPVILLHKVNVWPDNGKLEQIIKTVNKFYKEDITFEACMNDMNNIIISPPTCGIWRLIFAFIILGFSASIVMFHGTWIDGIVSGFLGGLVGLLLHLASSAPAYAPVYDITACAICAIIGRALHQYCCFNASVIPALLILLPGYNMTVSVVNTYIYIYIICLGHLKKYIILNLLFLFFFSIFYL